MYDNVGDLKQNTDLVTHVWCKLQECETGLYVCMSSFLGFGKNHVERYYRRTGNAVYMHMRRIKKEVSSSNSALVFYDI